MLEQKSDKTVSLDSVSMPFLNTSRAAVIGDLNSAITNLKQIDSKINRYMEKLFIVTVRSRGLFARCTSNVYLLPNPEIPKRSECDWYSFFSSLP